MFTQRFEYKYILDEMRSEMFLDYLRPRVEPDPNAGPRGSYTVWSLYYDNARMEMFWASEQGEKNRRKLRIRSYDNFQSGSVYLEIKRRMDQIIFKERAGICLDSVKSVLSGKYLEMSDLAGQDEAEWNSAHNFLNIAARLAASPLIMVRYERQPFICKDAGEARVTFDRRISCRQFESDGLLSDPDETVWHELYDYPVIMELKFTDSAPGWLRAAVQKFNLNRSSMSKYANCIKHLQKSGIWIESFRLQCETGIRRG